MDRNEPLNVGNNSKNTDMISSIQMKPHTSSLQNSMINVNSNITAHTISNANGTKNNNVDHIIVDEQIKNNFFILKTHVKNKRKATFCCLFSIGFLFVSVILFLASLSTHMLTDFNKYNDAQHTKCKIINIRQLSSNSSIENDDDVQCKYIYKAINNKSFGNGCETISEIACCTNPHGTDDYQNGTISDCVVYEGDTDDKCSGTMIDTIILQRTWNMFIILMVVGSIFSVVTIFSCIYAIRFMRISGIYCSIKSVQHDDDEIFSFIHQMNENENEQQNNKMIQMNESIK